MNAMRIRKVKSRRGAALTYVIVAFLLVSVYSVFIAYMVSTNSNHAKYQEQSMQAYYLSLSGTDLCIAALIQEGAGGEGDTLLNAMFNPSIANPVVLTDDLYLEAGLVNLTISAITKDGVRWVQIVAISVLHDSGESYTTTVQFQFSDPKIKNVF